MQPTLYAPEPMAAGSGPVLTAEELRRIASYDPETGEFTWLKDRGRAKAGTRAKRGRSRYVEIRINGKLYLGHRLAWLYMTGEWPSDRIDHEDTDESNNRWSNLREATHQQNLCNRGPNKNNTSGYKGVVRLKSGLFKANIKKDGKTKHLGVFDNPVSAHQAYIAAANRLHGEFARVA